MTTIRCYVVMGVIPCLLGPSRPFSWKPRAEAQAERDENRRHGSVQSRSSRPGLLSASPASHGGRAESAAAAAAAPGWPPKFPPPPLTFLRGRRPSATQRLAGGSRALSRGQVQEVGLHWWLKTWVEPSAGYSPQFLNFLGLSFVSFFNRSRVDLQCCVISGVKQGD